MIFNEHETLVGKHAFLGASSYSWLRWDAETLEKRYYGQYAQMIGTALHELAQTLITNRIKLSKGDKKIIDVTLSKLGVPKNSYDTERYLMSLIGFVNDAIGFRMDSEVILYYSYNCFGTADAIMFNEFDKILRIHDYKSGVSPCKMDQLMIYAALFCLEYHKNPTDFITELRIYQNGDATIMTAEPLEIQAIMNLIVDNNKTIIKYFERDRTK